MAPSLFRRGNHNPLLNKLVVNFSSQTPHFWHLPWFYIWRTLQVDIKSGGQKWLDTKEKNQWKYCVYFFRFKKINHCRILYILFNLRGIFGLKKSFLKKSKCSHKNCKTLAIWWEKSKWAKLVANIKLVTSCYKFSYIEIDKDINSY